MNHRAEDALCVERRTRFGLHKVCPRGGLRWTGATSGGMPPGGVDSISLRAGYLKAVWLEIFGPVLLDISVAIDSRDPPRSPGPAPHIISKKNQTSRPILRPNGDEQKVLPDCLQAPRRATVHFWHPSPVGAPLDPTSSARIQLKLNIAQNRHEQIICLIEGFLARFRPNLVPRPHPTGQARKVVQKAVTTNSEAVGWQFLLRRRKSAIKSIYIVSKVRKVVNRQDCCSVIMTLQNSLVSDNM